MGQLRDFDLNEYNCNVYVETGTGKCITLNKAHNTKFDRYYTVDIDLEVVNYAKKLFPTTKVEQDLSTNALCKWLKNDISEDDRVLFFLDAHFPGADYHGAGYDVNKENAIPLEQELELIKYNCKSKKYVIICDDARIYKHDNWENGFYPYEIASCGLDFVYKLFDEKNVKILFQEEGYILINNLSTTQPLKGLGNPPTR